MSRRDGADRLLAVAVRLLPPDRREWGAAMRAELSTIDGSSPRWRFSLGCARVVTVQPSVLRLIAYLVATAGVLVAMLIWSARVSYAPLRWGLVGLVAVLMLVGWLGRLRGALGPVEPRPSARAVRAGGYLLIGALAAEAVWFMARAGNPDNQAGDGVPVFTVIFVGYLAGLLALTAQRPAGVSRVLTTGALAGIAAATVWTITAVLAPPLPPGVGRAVLLTIVGVGVASVSVGRRSNAGEALRAGTAAAIVAVLLILNVVTAVSAFGPGWLIPDLAPAALTPADDLAQSRIELGDHYLWLLVLGWFVAIGQLIVSLTQRRPSTVAASPSPL